MEFFHKEQQQHSSRLLEVRENTSPDTQLPSPTTNHPLEPVVSTTLSEKEEAKPKKLAPKCLYRIEYRDEEENLVYEKEGSSPSDVALPTRPDEPVMEVITTIEVKTNLRPKTGDFNPELAKEINQGTEVKINSPLLINALRAVVSYVGVLRVLFTYFHLFPPGGEGSIYSLNSSVSFLLPYYSLIKHPLERAILTLRYFTVSWRKSRWRIFIIR